MTRKRYQGSAEWLAERQTGIGSSDAPVIAGVSPFGDPDEQLRTLWAEKRGYTVPAITTETMEWGHRLEAVVADAYAEQEGVRLRRVEGIQRHPQQPFMLASLDRRVIGGDRRLVEVKTTASRGDRWGAEHTAEVPEHVLTQVLHQLAVTGAPVADVAVLFLRERHLGVYTIERDGKIITLLEQMEAAFWAAVQAGTPPEPMQPAAALIPLRADEVIADEQTTALVEQVLTARAIAEEAERRKEELEASLKDHIADVGAVRGDAFHITYRPTVERVKTDWRAVASAYRSLIERIGAGDLDDRAELDAIERNFTTVSAGTRPLRLTTRKDAAA